MLQLPGLLLLPMPLSQYRHCGVDVAAAGHPCCCLVVWGLMFLQQAAAAPPALPMLAALQQW
jgi:hypothetical protein